MKEHCFSIAIEAPNNQGDSLVRGRVVTALNQAGFRYQSIKDIAAQDHWNRAAQTNNRPSATALLEAFKAGRMSVIDSKDFTMAWRAFQERLNVQSGTAHIG